MSPNPSSKLGLSLLRRSDTAAAPTLHPLLLLLYCQDPPGKEEQLSSDSKLKFTDTDISFKCFAKDCQ